jgi:uncharacterized protein with ParB-like and HNH nuclease domain
MARITEKYIWGIEDTNGYRFDISPKTIYEFLNSNNNSIRKIPDYQRPYSWDKSHVEKLLQDILKYSKIEEEHHSWFLGTIYTTKKTSNDTTSLVLDGQQRLTTIQLILRELSFFIYFDPSLEFNNPDYVSKFNDLVDAANQCLYVNISAEHVLRFETEPTTNEFLKTYFLKTRRINNHRELKGFINDFETLLSNSDSINESLTLKNLRNHINTIRAFIKKIFLDIEGEDSDTKLHRLNSFFHTILYKFWLIEIPLREEEFSIEIFEGINNRGKALSLIDKIQFRSLSNASFNRSKIRAEWKNIYIKLEKLTEAGSKSIFNSHEEFFKLYFLAIQGSEFKSDDDYLSEFDDYLESETILFERFFDKVNIILDFLIEVENPTRTNNKFSSSFPDLRREREKIISLLHLLRKTLIVAGNGRQLLISFLYHYNPYQLNADYNVPRSLWNIIRLVFTLDIIEIHKSNAIRSHFNKINRNAKRNNNIFLKLEQLFDPPSEGQEESQSLSKNILFENHRVLYNLYGLSNNLVSSSSNEESSLILYMYAYLKDIYSLCIGSEIHFQTLELEHIFPRKWKSYWSDKTYDKNEMAQEVNRIGEIKQVNQNFIHSLANDILTEDFELKHYETRQSIQEKSLIEWIGNKVCYHGSMNSSVSNKSFTDKKLIYSDSTVSLFPNSINEISVMQYVDFGPKDIISRSLEITCHIIDNLFSKDWDLVD